MSSPFPGMDPYLERHWLDVHTQLVAGARSALNRVLPEDLVARSEERLSVESEGIPTFHNIVPDVRVFENTAGEAAATSDTIVAPFKLVVDLEPVTERFVKILRADDEQLITVIEFVSPSNNIGRGLRQFVKNRSELLKAGVHFVEIDLVRRGNWRALLRPHICPSNALSPYRGVIRIAGRRDTAYFFPMSMREPLPSLPIPLRAGDPEVRLELQPLVDDAYASGRYARTMDYARPCDPPLEEEHAQWMREHWRPAS